MTISRRQFLGSVLALAAAPAVVRAESLMKLWVPKHYLEFGVEPNLIVPGQDYNLSFWMKDKTSDWVKVHKKFMWHDIKDGRIRIDVNQARHLSQPLITSNYPVSFSSFQLEKGNM